MIIVKIKLFIYLLKKRKLLLFPYGEKEDNQDFVTVKLQYLDEKNTNEVIYAKIIFFMKGINNSCFTMKGK